MLGTLIREKRKEQGLTQRQLAKILVISPQYLNDIEQGNRHPTDDYLIAMFACILHVSQDYLYFLANRLPPDIRDTPINPDEAIQGFNSIRKLLREREI